MSNVLFPVVFCSCAVKPRENLVFPNPVQTKTAEKEAFPRELLPRLQRARNHQTGSARTPTDSTRTSSRTHEVRII